MTTVIDVGSFVVAAMALPALIALLAVQAWRAASHLVLDLLTAAALLRLAASRSTTTLALVTAVLVVRQAAHAVSAHHGPGTSLRGRGRPATIDVWRRGGRSR